MKNVYFLVTFTDPTKAPRVQAFDRRRRRLRLFVSPDDSQYFDVTGERNTGYWLEDEMKLEWVLPMRPTFPFVFSSRREPDQRCFKRLHVDGFKFPASPSVRHLGGAKVFASALLIDTGGTVVNVDPSQAQESVRRNILGSQDGGYWVRRTNHGGVQVGRGCFVGTNLDFLFFEALVYGLPKILEYLERKDLHSHVPVVNDYLHPAVAELWGRILELNALPPAIRPGPERPLVFEKLALICGGTDWVEALRSRDEEVSELRRQLCDRLPVAEHPAKLFLVRNQGARKFENRLPKNFGEIMEKYARSGYHVVDLGALPILEQVHLVSGAKDIVSPHGGALAHLIWAKAGTRVTEIFAGWNDNCF